MNLNLDVLGRKIAFSTLVQYGGKFIQIVIAGLTLKYISSFLSESNYGIYGTISEYALFFSVVANLGIFANIVRSMSDNPNDEKVFFNILILRIASAFVFFMGAVAILYLNGSSPAFILGATFFFGSLFFDFITSVCDGVLQANYKMGKATIALIIGKLITLLTLFLITKELPHANMETTLPLIFLATITGSFITAIISFYFVLKNFALNKVKMTFKIDKTFMLQIFKISLPFGLITIINNLYFRFLPDYFSNALLTDAQFASFNISFRIAQVISLLSTFLMFSALPGLKAYIDEKHWKKAAALYKKLGIFLLISGVFIIMIGSFFGPQIIELLTHKKYFLPEFWFMLPLMLLLAAISYGYDLVLITIFAAEEDNWLLKTELLALAVSLVFFFGANQFESTQLKLLSIILGAIAGETIMVVLGIMKIKEIFKETPEMHPVHLEPAPVKIKV